MALGYNAQDFALVMHVSLVQLILDTVARRGVAADGASDLPISQSLNGVVTYTIPGGSRKYHAEVAAGDEWRDYSGSGNAALAARNEGRGAGMLRCFRLKVYDRSLVETQLTPPRVTMIDTLIPFWFVNNGFLSLVGTHLVAEPQAAAASL